MFPQHQKEKTSLSSGDILKEAGHVMGKPAEHTVLVLVQVLVVHHLLPACLHVHLHLILGRQLQALLDALRQKKEYIRGFTTNIDYLENIASYHRNHDVDVVDEEEGLIDHSVGDVGQVVCQVEHHGQRVAGGVVELLQEVHQDGTPLRLGAGEGDDKIDLSLLAKYDEPAETRVEEAI